MNWLTALKKRSVTRQAIALATIPATLLAVALTVYFSTTRINDLERSFIERGQVLAADLATTSQFGLLSGNSAILQATADELLQSPDVISVEIRDSLEDNVFAGRRITNSDRVSAPITVPAVPVFDFEQTTEPAEQTLGMVTVGLSRERLQQRTQRILLTGVLIILLAVVVIGVIAAILARRALRPVQHLATVVQDIKAGRLETQIHQQPVLEWHILAEGLRDMKARLKQGQDELQEQVDTATGDLQQSMEELEVRNIELDLARRQAQRADQAKSAFLANVSHEVRTPLNAIVGIGELLRKEPLSDRQQQQVGVLLDSANGLSEIIRDILDISALDSKSIQPRPVDISLRHEMEQILSLMAYQAHRQQNELLLRVYDDVPDQIRIDGSRLRQVLLHLLSNALKFTNQGDVVLRVMSDDDMDGPQGRYLRFEIADSGVGIDEGIQARLFETFEIGSMGLDREQGGVGIGLPLAKRLVALLSGTIGFESDAGNGSVFWVRLPIENAGHPPLSFGDLLAQKTISIYDGHPETGRVLAHQIAMMGAQIQTLDDLNNIPKADLLCIGLTGTQSNDQGLHEQIQSIAKKHTILLTISESANAALDYWQQTGVQQVQTRPISRRNFRNKILACLGLPETSDEANTGEHPTLIGYQLLAVDDNPINLEVLKELTQAMGAHVETAESGHDALLLCERKSFDVILLDLHMPAMSGIETVRRLRASSSANAAVPVIAVTADIASQTADDAHLAGINGILHKPVHEYDLKSALSEVLHQDNISPVDSKTTMPNHAAQALLAHDPELAARIQTQLLQQLSETLPSIRSAAKREDWDFVATAIHRLVGAAMYCDLAEFVDAGREVETFAREGGNQQRQRAFLVFQQAAEIALRQSNQTADS